MGLLHPFSIELDVKSSQEIKDEIPAVKLKV